MSRHGRHVGVDEQKNSLVLSIHMDRVKESYTRINIGEGLCKTRQKKDVQAYVHFELLGEGHF